MLPQDALEIWMDIKTIRSGIISIRDAHADPPQLAFGA